MQWVIFLKKAFIISGVFISGLIGAGFATGSEIYYYFAKFGKYGFFGIILSVFLFSVVQFCVLNQSVRFKSFVLDNYLKNIMPKSMSLVISCFSYVFMLFILSAMLSGFGEMAYEMYGIKKLYGALLILIFTVLIISKGHKGFIMSESVLSVLIILILTGVCVYILVFREQNITAFNADLSWAGSAVSYTGYNMLTSTAILCIAARDSDRKSSYVSAFITFIVLSVLMYVMWYIICLYSGMINLGAMPLLKICLRHSYALSVIYSLAVFISMLTTAVSAGYALIIKCREISESKFVPGFVYAMSLFLAGLDFSFIVNKLYRIAGFFSLLLLFYIFSTEVRKIFSKK